MIIEKVIHMELLCKVMVTLMTIMAERSTKMENIIIEQSKNRNHDNKKNPRIFYL